MNNNKRLYIIAGEPSGDFLGASLIDSIRRHNKDIEIYGIGGDMMKSSGIKSLFDIQRISVGGIFEVIPHIFDIKNLIDKTVCDIIEKKPCVVVTIDSPGFCFRVAKKLRKLNINLKLIHYVAPSVWAWRKNRAKKIARLYDHLFTLFDFEVPYFEREKLETTFIGHPAVENFEFHDISSRRGNNDILIMPGSRLQEIKNLLPIFLEVASRNNFDNVIIPTFDHFIDDIQRYTSYYKDLNIIIETDEHKKKEYFYSSKLSIVSSGTATLQLALSGCPMIVAYKISRLSYEIIKRLIKIKYISLVNIIMNKKVVPEMIQKDCSCDKIDLELKNLDIDFQIDNFKNLRKHLINNNKNPSDLAAEIILDKYL